MQLDSYFRQWGRRPRARQLDMCIFNVLRHLIISRMRYDGELINLENEDSMSYSATPNLLRVRSFAPYLQSNKGAGTPITTAMMASKLPPRP